MTSPLVFLLKVPPFPNIVFCKVYLFVGVVAPARGYPGRPFNPFFFDFCVFVVFFLRPVNFPFAPFRVIFPPVQFGNRHPLAENVSSWARGLHSPFPSVVELAFLPPGGLVLAPASFSCAFPQASLLILFHLLRVLTFSKRRSEPLDVPPP